ELLDDLHKLGTSTLATLENIAANSDELALRPCRLLAGDGNVLIRELVAEDDEQPTRSGLGHWPRSAAMRSSSGGWLMNSLRRP
ncbi:MAG: hypothetical protein ACO3C6_11615, partial [Steroidobacteraceae bacterium]